MPVINKRTVLIVEDELINRRILGKIVGSEYEVLYAENGKTALETIRRQPKTISLILLDLLMPVMDGFQLLDVIQSDDQLRRIPVIVLTADKTAEVRSLRAGAADFIPKPYDMPEVILARVSRSIKLAEDSGIISATETDALTGLYTREFFQEYCERYDLYHPDASMDAVALNINRFHLVNALGGRSRGDEVLCAAAEQIRKLAAGVGIACRCEADVFLLYMPHRESWQDVLDGLTTAICRAMGQATLSVRMGVYPEADRAVTVAQRFDRALHVCNIRRSGYRSACYYYDNHMYRRELYHEQLIGEMETAMKEKQFKVYFQPKYAIRGERPVLAGAEALIRWEHPTLGRISPGEFIPLFETNGLIRRLDSYVWSETAAQLHRWKEQFGVSIPVSVNVSRTELYDANLEDELLSLVALEHLHPQELHLEITESAYTKDDDQLIDAVSRLRGDGFFIEMDDFGSGYSSLNTLTSLPFDALKLDMRFIRRICDSEKDCRVVGLVGEIAAFMGVPVIAEGVEEYRQYELLRKLGVDMIQGYLFSAPVPPEQFEKLLQNPEWTFSE